MSLIESIIPFVGILAFIVSMVVWWIHCQRDADRQRDAQNQESKAEVPPERGPELAAAAEQMQDASDLEEPVPEESTVVVDNYPHVIRAIVTISKKNLIATILVIVMVIGLAWNIADRSALRKSYETQLAEVQLSSYNDGYAEGEDAGEKSGYSSGYDAGKSVGYTTGYNSGLVEGQSEGYESGYSDGEAVSYDSGYSAGYSDGESSAQEASYSSGYEAGYADGEDAGYSSGYDDGKESAESDKAVSTSDNSSDSNDTSSKSSSTVYVSRTGKIHTDPNCSGMKYYTEMPYAEAIAKGYDKCKKCYR